MTDLSRRAPGPEILDADDVGPETFAAVMDDLAAVSRVMLAHAPTIGFLQRATSGLPLGSRISVLDVGSGEGDLLRRIRRWSNRRGLQARLTGLDLNPRSEGAANARTPAAMAIEYVTGDVFDYPGQADFVVSSLFTHHLTDGQVIDFLRWMDARAARGWFVNDLHRHRIAYTGFGIAARLARWHRIVRLDGQTSVARSFRVGDWRALLAAAGVEAQLRWRPMFRLCVEGLGRAN
ncbi:methyltransferase domain-containing protein [Lichenicoccus sp.]|uniref:methyltransferase domain-containing protein n=1 Tax=Lichenicoccus sp. TaxID=2781899 RepID=UPI003D0CCF96